jgi:hypothetical protein
VVDRPVRTFHEDADALQVLERDFLLFVVIERRAIGVGFNETDEFCPVWRLFDLLPESADGWRPKQTYG